MITLLLAPALAFTDPDPFIDAPLSGTRPDAPSDAQLVWDANVAFDAMLLADGEQVGPLVTRLGTGVGAAPRVVVEPPAGGWPEAVELTVTAGVAWMDDTSAMVFQAVDAGASAPPAVLASATVSSWSSDSEYPWGCCTDVRTVTFEVTVPEGDPWSGFEIRGDFAFSEPTQITEQPIQFQLGLEVGPGLHVVTLEQWMDREEGTPQPPCFEVRGRSASGALGPAEAFCFDDAPGLLGGGTGCASAGALGMGVGAWSLLAVGAVRRRR